MDYRCRICKLRADEIQEYVLEAANKGMTIEEYVAKEDDIFHPITHEFLCTECFIFGQEEGAPIIEEKIKRYYDE